MCLSVTPNVWLVIIILLLLIIANAVTFADIVLSGLYIYTYICADVNVYICTYVYIYICLYTHTHNKLFNYPNNPMNFITTPLYRNAKEFVSYKHKRLRDLSKVKKAGELELNPESLL